MKTPLLVFGEDWGGHPSSTQHLIREISQSRKIYWVNSLGLRQPRLTSHDVKRAFKKLTSVSPTKPANNTTNANIEVLNPLTLPAPRSSLARALAAHLTAWQINRRWPELQQARPWVWTSLPTAGDLRGRFNEQGWLYYCCDDFSSLAGVDHASVDVHEQQLVKAAEHVVVTSDHLAQKHRQHAPMRVDHGVDMTLFADPKPMAKEITDARPCVGFYGSLDDWIDLARICRLALARPHIDFHLVGHIKSPCPEQMPSNVHWLGPRAHAELATYSQHWKACLLPFKSTPQIHACNPLKLKEYLATGRPVISTDFPASRNAQGVWIANTDAQWLRAIDRSLMTVTQHPPRWIYQYSWQAISQKINGLLADPA